MPTTVSPSNRPGILVLAVSCLRIRAASSSHRARTRYPMSIRVGRQANRKNVMSELQRGTGSGESGIHRVYTERHETLRERQRQKEIVDRLPRPSDDPSATSLRVRRCLFSSLVACRWHDISKMAAARAAPARDAGTKGPRLSPLLGLLVNAQLSGPALPLRWLDREDGRPCSVSGMPAKLFSGSYFPLGDTR